MNKLIVGSFVAVLVVFTAIALYTNLKRVNDIPPPPANTQPQ
ncbi:hypothetical protein [Flaviflagellibacter deserti]|jgi:hypothetical protein|uniref:Uncharacterized protein n=1 Tax=Flaviflagellibacter deserti TaxID=2267266 RepID=A0ABV9Z152_9HYPH